jgi:hypothetical protein
MTSGQCLDNLGALQRPPVRRQELCDRRDLTR